MCSMLSKSLSPKSSKLCETNCINEIINRLRIDCIGADTILGVRRIFSQFSQNPKSFVYLCPQIFSHKEHEDCFRCDPKKGLNCVFLQTLDGIFWSQAALGTMFAWIFKDFAKIIFNKSKLLGVRLHLLNPHLLHHWLTCHYFVLVLVFVWLNNCTNYKEK